MRECRRYVGPATEYRASSGTFNRGGISHTHGAGAVMIAIGPGKVAAFGGGKVPAGFLVYNFDPGRADLKPEHRQGLQELVAGVVSGGRTQVQIIGRASRDETPGTGLGISQERAEAVQRYLVTLGASPAQLSVQARGEPFGFPAGPEEDRGVIVVTTIPGDFVIGLRTATRVHGVNWPVVEQVVREGFDSIARDAGRPLRLNTGNGQSTADVAILFTDSNATLTPCRSRMIILGIVGESVFVNTHLQLRTCNGSAPGPAIFTAADRDFALALGNTAAHELGHRLANLDEVGDLSNMMFKETDGSGPSPHLRSRSAALARLSGKKSWNTTQRDALVQAIMSGNYVGGMRTR